jgi:hypothetical protein
MLQKNLTIDNFRDLIAEGDAKDPLIFLESLMSGFDPRQLSDLYELICEIDSFTDGNISKNDWDQIVNLVTSRYKFEPVDIQTSLTAGRTLAEYVHAKKKQVEVNGKNGDYSFTIGNLTEDEIVVFREKFNEEY